MTSEHSTIKLKMRELHAQLATLTAALAILSGKRPAAPSDNDVPKKERKVHRDQFDAMMSTLSARKGRPIAAVQLRKELLAKGQYTGTDSTIFNHLSKAVKLGYVLKRADGYRVSSNIRKITQKAAGKPAKAKHVNGVAAPKHLTPTNYDFVLAVLRDSEGPQKASAIHATANSRGGSMKDDTRVYGFLTRAVKEGLVKKSADGYAITEKGKAAE